jgi:ubiquinone/menaquinone biosynthesis C-methylase UbiE
VDLSPDEALHATFEGCDLLGPGGPEETRRLAREMGLGAGMRVLELGGGTGRAACQLAREFGVRVVTVERDPVFAAIARARLGREGALGRVEVLEADFAALPGPLAPGTFDAIFAEGSLHLLGIERGCALATRLLKPGQGVIGFTHITWLLEVDEVPPAVRAFWEREAGPAIDNFDQIMRRVADAGFGRGFAYPLPPEAWDRYYEPIRRNLAALRARGARSPLLDAIEEEIAAFDAGGRESVGYVAYVAYPGDPPE